LAEIIAFDSSPCPDSALLTAFVDQELNGQTRGRVEAHLADCDMCRQVVAETVRLAREDLPTSRSAAAETPSAAAAKTHFRFRTRTMAGAATLLVAAASLVIVVRLQPDWIRLGRGAPIEELVAATSTERSVEGRLTGGFRYAPFRPPTRGLDDGSGATLDIRAVAARVRENADRRPTPENLHALGAAHLLIGRYDDAVRVLEGVANQLASDAQVQNDLAVAYYMRARALDQPADFERSLAAAERAIQLDGALSEAYFNQALVLEGLGRIDAAERAWREYLRRDSSSDWAAEAHRHLP
jgi:tetratricopeptide (TPR) repeat protein